MLHTGRTSSWAATQVPVTFVAFDLLHLDGQDLTGLALAERKRLLDELHLVGPTWATNGWYPGDGDTLFQVCGGPRLLIVDEVGYLPLPAEAAAALFQVVSQRYLKGSIALTTNLGIASWGKVFNDDPMIAGAMLDRLLHRSVVINIDGGQLPDALPPSSSRGHPQGRARLVTRFAPTTSCPVCSTPTPADWSSEQPWLCSTACLRLWSDLPEPQPETPSCHDSVTMTCPVCQRSFVPIGRQKFCSDACLPTPTRHAAGPARRAQIPAPPADHRLPMRRLRQPGPRRAKMPGLLNLHAQDRNRRQLPLL